MTIAVANVSNTDTFGSWLQRTNTLATIASQNAVTVDATSSGSLSTGNAYVNGHFGANTLVALTGIAGGSLTAGNTLTLLTNTAFVFSGANVVSMAANSGTSSFTVTTNSVSITANNGNTLISANFLNINTSTTNVRSTAINANGVVTITGNTAVRANAVFNVLTISGNSLATTILANTNTTTVVGNVSLANTLSVIGSITTSNTLSVNGATTLSNTLSVAGTANVGGNLGVVGNANIAGNISVAGNFAVTGSLTYSGTATGNLVPASTSFFNIGNSSSSWLFGYFDNVVSSNTVATMNLASTGTATLNTVTVANTLSVTRAATLSNTIAVTGNATFSNTVVVTGNATFSSRIAVTGNATFSNTIAVTGSAVLSNTLSVAGTANIVGNVATGSTIVINATAHQFVTSFTFNNSTATANVDLVSASTFRTYEYTLQLSDTTISPTPRYHVTKILIIHDGSTPYMTEYGTMFNVSSLGTFDAVINGGNIALQLTPATANVVVRFVRTSIIP